MVLVTTNSVGEGLKHQFSGLRVKTPSVGDGLTNSVGEGLSDSQ